MFLKFLECVHNISLKTWRHKYSIQQDLTVYEKEVIHQMLTFKRASTWFKMCRLIPALLILLVPIPPNPHASKPLSHLLQEFQ